MSPDRIILGIDPGTRIMGWGVIGIYGSNARFISMGVLDFKRDNDHHTKLNLIFKEVSSLIQRFKPHELAVEAPFYGKNVQSMLKLGRAQGVAISAALSYNLPITEYAPRKIKLSITGKGSASKEQVASVISKILSVEQMPESLDATDGLAVAFCHFLTSSVVTGLQRVSDNGKTPKIKPVRGGSWESFVRNNPGRVK